MVTFLFDNNSGAPNALLFENPREVIRADEPHEVEAALARLTALQEEGLYAAGFLSFELGYVLEPKLAPLLPASRQVPLLLFGVYPDAVSLTPEEVDRWLSAKGAAYALQDIRPSLSQASYDEKFERTLDYIGAGDIYQLNLTFKARFQLDGSRAALFRELRRKQRVRYGTFMETDSFTILSLSPELFVETDGSHILTRPMKGTAQRGLTAAEDEALREWLAADIKSRAENLMIVDLMRNDISRIAQPGSVGVPDLFTVETFETILQMTSGVEAKLRSGVGFADLAHALFPPGSVTGTPKVRAVEIIRELEDEPRGVYTGAIGVLRPRSGCLFNVAIRTLYVGADGAGEIGVGSGLVQDSRADSEYDECLLKLKFLSDPPLPEFELIETLRYDRGEGYALLGRHLARLEQSALRFAFPFKRAKVDAALRAHAEALEGASHRVRLTLDRRGKLAVTSMPLPAAPQRKMTYAIAAERTNPGNLFLHHKTTNRRFYDETRAALAKTTGCDEALFLNTRGELTEGSFTNLFVEIGGELLTPALSCGLLPGTLREELIEQSRAREAVLSLDDLAKASAIWLGNSVRGLIPAEPVGVEETERRAAR